MAETRVKLDERVVLRVEDDSFALLYDPESGDRFVLDPVGVRICSCLDGAYGLEEIVAELRAEFDGVPMDAEEQVRAFIADLVRRGLAR